MSGSRTELFRASEGRYSEESSREEGPPSSLADVLDLYVVHFLMALLFIAGSIMLIDRYVVNQEKANNTANDFFYAIGGLALLANVLFVIGLFIAWIGNKAEALARDDIEIHWLHAFSLFASASSLIWSIYAMILTFGSTLTGPTTDSVQVAGYFMVLFSAVYFAYLLIRSMFGLIGRGKPPPPSIKGKGLLTSGELFDEANRRSATSIPPMASTMFSGAMSRRTFGEDLNDMRTSSMSTLPPTQDVRSGGNGCGQMPYPVMMMPQMMAYAAPNAACTTDPNAVHIN